MDFKAKVTGIRDCGCEQGCQHKIVSVTEDYMVHESKLAAFLDDLKSNP
jgi:hypothetical protein